jgi:hypothetical protein
VLGWSEPAWNILEFTPSETAPMRLTLRTLLAWLDDTLPPAEVREIGRQVNESPFAQELVDRIHRVSRQRRLTVPNSSGPEATDPNLVAAYLDNELSPEQVAEFEKLCLTSDVHLAEAASVHQILSLIGQKAKVPPEARQRMYRLVKGREALASRKGSAGNSHPTPLTEPLPPWAPPEPPPRPAMERYGPAAAVLALIAILIVSAWLSLPRRTTLTSSTPSPLAAATPTAPPKEKVPANLPAPGPAEAKAEAAPSGAAEPEKTAAETAPAEKAKPPEARPEAKPDETEAPSAPRLPAGAVGMTDKANAGVLLLASAEGQGWERLPRETGQKRAERETVLKADAHILNLAPFRDRLQLDSVQLDLVGEAEVKLLARREDLGAVIEPVRGRFVIHAQKPAAALGIRRGGKLLKITPPSDAPVGLEVIDRVEGGQVLSALRIFAASGEVGLAVGDAEVSLKGPGSMLFVPPDQFSEVTKREPPEWVTSDSLSPAEKQLADQFAKYLGPPSKKIINGLLEAMDDEQKEIKQLAMTGLGAIGAVDLVVPALGSENAPTTRRAAIRVIRALLPRGPETVKAIEDQLVERFGAADTAIIEKLLLGFSDRESRDEKTYAALVEQLHAENVAIRELALDNLKRLTGRDDLGYNPDKPEGPGLRNWQELLARKELRPQPPAPAVPKAR